MAVDMIELYNEACALERIKPIQKLLEQLEVRTYVCNTSLYLHSVFSACTYVCKSVQL